MASARGRASPRWRITVEREANYAAVGAFVVLVVVMGALFVYWYSDSREHKDYTRYEIYFDGSVSGLERGAAVRYLGVDVGRVNDMRVDPRDASRVMVIADIDSTAPISQRTIAELSLQGVTGLLYIDLITNARNRRLVEAVPSLEYPVIRSARSNLDVFLSSLPEIVSLARELVERANSLLSDENLASVSRSLDSIDRASAQLPQTVREVNALASELRAVAGDIRAVTQDMGPELSATMRRVNEMADNLVGASEQLEQFVKDNGADLRSFTRDTLPEFERFLRDGRTAAREISALAQGLRENPSQLIYQTPPRGVEIPR
jgi:phospholipid/cholesterol/gamma-HCH transport system substrate-binding protein